MTSQNRIHNPPPPPPKSVMNGGHGTPQRERGGYRGTPRGGGQRGSSQWGGGRPTYPPQTHEATPSPNYPQRQMNQYSQGQGSPYSLGHQYSLGGFLPQNYAQVPTYPQ